MKKAFVLGLGLSGLATAEFLLTHGYYVVGFDDKKKIDSRENFESYSDLNDLNFHQFDLAIVSPGISPQHPAYKKAIESGIEVIGEAELAFRYLKQRALGITGTNGKTTVTLLVEHILNAVGIKAKAVGNVGVALLSYLLNPDLQEVLVVELSSFQLETAQSAVFDAGILLNVTPDHLDRYADMEAYAAAKCRLQKCVKRHSPFFVQEAVIEKYGYLLEEGYERFEIESFLSFGYRDLVGHELENVTAAWSLCRPFAISARAFCEALDTFRKPPHRIEFVKEIDGISFFDDSKGTNIDAVIQAIQVMKGPVVLIAGGVDKGSSYLPWREVFEGKVKCIVAIGQASQKIYGELSPFFEVKLAESLASAVEISAEKATKGDNVLLSPGCSSYDMFRDYAHRGEQFQQFVHQLVERREKT